MAPVGINPLPSLQLVFVMLCWEILFIIFISKTVLHLFMHFLLISIDVLVYFSFEPRILFLFRCIGTVIDLYYENRPFMKK